jgi:carboxymethylenebutenolidase
MRAVRTKMTIPPVMDDIGAMLAFLEQQKEVKRGVVGCHGYCMSGPYALAAAARYPDRIAAAASFYGTWLVSEAEESPHLSLGKVKGELYIGCAEHDKLAPLPMVQELRTLFSRAGAAGEIELYPGVHHGFAFPQTLVLRQAGRGAPLGAADRALPTTLGVGSIVSALLTAVQAGRRRSS